MNCPNQIYLKLIIDKSDHYNAVDFYRHVFSNIDSQQIPLKPFHYITSIDNNCIKK